MDTNGHVDVFDVITKTRRAGRDGSSSSGLAIDDVDAFPVLTSLLRESAPGAPKGAKPGRIAIFAYQGKLTLCVSVPSKSAVCFYTAEGFSDALQRLEAAIKGCKVEWRDDRPLKGR